MAIDVLKQFEAVPASYPAAPSGLSTAAAALDPDMIWARIEAYTAYRYSAREVVWTLIGDTGAVWSAPLAPVNSYTADFWLDEAWETISLLPAPIGLCLQGGGYYRITAQVGGGTVPAPVSEAFKRLAEYVAAEAAGVPGASRYSIDMGQVSESITRHPAFMARALDNSGAADLLRPFRRV